MSTTLGRGGWPSDWRERLCQKESLIFKQGIAQPGTNKLVKRKRSSHQTSKKVVVRESGGTYSSSVELETKVSGHNHEDSEEFDVQKTLKKL